MTRPTLTVVEGGGKPEPDGRIIDALEQALERAKAGGIDGAFILLDGPERGIWCAGDDILTTACLAEVYAQGIKGSALGLGEE